MNISQIESNEMLHASNSQSFTKRVLIAIIVVMPVSFGINIPLNSIFPTIPVWSVILFNSFIISAYMVFMIPKAMTLAHIRLRRKDGKDHKK